jgi:hypothetical protein
MVLAPFTVAPQSRLFVLPEVAVAPPVHGHVNASSLAMHALSISTGLVLLPRRRFALFRLTLTSKAAKVALCGVLSRSIR